VLEEVRIRRRVIKRKNLKSCVFSSIFLRRGGAHALLQNVLRN
jgi:hypothetical protein